MCQPIFVNRSLKLKFAVEIRKKMFSQNSVNEIGYYKVIHVLSEFVITNYIFLNNDFSGICYFRLNSLFQILN